MPPVAFEALGWLGMSLLLLAYAFRDRMSRRANAMTNLAGAASLAVSLAVKEAWPGLTLEAVWALIAVRDLVRDARARSAGPRAR